MDAPSLILDFDGTMTQVDVGDALCERFADPTWKEIDRRYIRGELSLPEAQKQMWSLFRATRAQACAFALEVGQLRPGLDELLRVAEERDIAIHLASGGLDFYIEAILGPRRLARFSSVCCNTARFHGDRLKLIFAEGFGCERCAVCKGKVVERCGPQSVFVGDGASDMCAIGKAQRIFAVRGGHLHKAAQGQNAHVVSFDDLREVAAAL